MIIETSSSRAKSKDAGAKRKAKTTRFLDFAPLAKTTKDEQRI
jgi:hypothetical protein